MPKLIKYQAKRSGFLAIRCEKCGELKGFFSREAIAYSRCKLCDRKTELKDLAPAELKCKCGRRCMVSTNLTDRMITIICPICRAPVDLELDREGSTYRTMEGYDE